MNKKKLNQNLRAQLKIIKNQSKIKWKENKRRKIKMTIKMTQISIIKQLVMKLHTMIQLLIFGKVFRLALIK